jgi:hypothetical protein
MNKTGQEALRKLCEVYDEKRQFCGDLAAGGVDDRRKPHEGLSFFGACSIDLALGAGSFRFVFGGTASGVFPFCGGASSVFPC